MKNLSKAIALSMATLFAVPYAKQEAMAYGSGYASVEIDHQEAEMFVAALQSAARDWLVITQDLSRMYGQGQIRKTTLDAAVRNARLFQDDAVNLASKINQKDYTAAIDDLDYMATSFSLVRGTHRDLVREIRMLIFQANHEAEKIKLRRQLRDIDDRFSRIRTLYYGLSNLLSTGSIY